ncbi:MAG TPA: thiamine diphosphokinase [bacterium]|jgi:thiamine pyrophosphokinase
MPEPLAPYGLNLLRDHYDALLVANGAPISRRLFSQLRKRSGLLIALDGGVNALFRYKTAPDWVAGDLDSATPQSLAWARENGSAVRKLLSQESPDMAKGMEFCRGLGCRNVLVAGFSGARTDHVLSSLTFAFRVRGVEVELITDDVLVMPLRGRVEREFAVPRGHTLSWFAFPKAGPCALRGVRWPFRNRLLTADGFHSLSNLPVEPVVQLFQRAGRSLLVVSLRPQTRP